MYLDIFDLLISLSKLLIYLTFISLAKAYICVFRCVLKVLIDHGRNLLQTILGEFSGTYFVKLVEP